MKGSGGPMGFEKSPTEGFSGAGAASGGSCVATPGWESSTSGPPCSYPWHWITSCHLDSMSGECTADTVERTQECR